MVRYPEETETIFSFSKVLLEKSQKQIKKGFRWENKNNEGIHNKCFTVGVNPAFKQIVCTEEFWPMGVAHTRFDFARGRHFLDNR